MKIQRYYGWLLSMFLMFVIVCSNGLALSNPASPALMDVNASGAAGDWYVGAIPTNYDSLKPVLVFVQGKGDQASSWWDEIQYYGTNDMYDYAYSAGYRTAFVNFDDADGNEGSMWTNGSVLSKQLQQICAYFGVSKVSLICHSKGGIDAQAAIVYYGAAERVNTVFTLSTPHWGSELADLAYSSAAEWLADLLGQKSEAAYVLQTGYMAYFRSITDTRSENDQVTYYTAAGTDWGPTLSPLSFGGLYLSSFGDNDGAVTVTSAHNPLATHVSTSDLNHYNIRVGRNVWPLIGPTVGVATKSALDTKSSTSRLSATASPQAKPVGNYWLTGGKLVKDGSVVIKIPVESSASAVKFDLLLANPTATIQLTSPNGMRYSPQTQFKDQTFFKGATHLVTEVTQPEAGYWKLTINSNPQNAYLLIALYESELQANLSANQPQPGSPLQFNLDWNDKLAKKIAKANVTARLSQSVKTGRSSKVANIPFAAKRRGFVNTTTLPTETGMYNVNVSVTGVLDDGTPFARSQVRSIVVDSNHEKSVEFLKKLEKK